AKKQRARRQLAQTIPADDACAANNGDALGRELRVLLDDEVSRLPDKYRLPIVLCHLEGKSNGEAAEQLHCELSALPMPLLRARELLGRRLGRRGGALSAGGLATVLDQAAATAALPPALATAAVQTATQLGAVNATDVVALADATLRTMTPSKSRMAAGI